MNLKFHSDRKSRKLQIYRKFPRNLQSLMNLNFQMNQKFLTFQEQMLSRKLTL
jgi:hypothetical protein